MRRKIDAYVVFKLIEHLIVTQIPWFRLLKATRTTVKLLRFYWLGWLIDVTLLSSPLRNGFQWAWLAFSRFNRAAGIDRHAVQKNVVFSYRSRLKKINIIEDITQIPWFRLLQTTTMN